MKYLLHLAYRGSNYHGWQRQPKHPSVQQTLEEALEKMLGRKTVVIGCGRTDTGVHASQYFAHIKVPEPFDKSFEVVTRLNQILPEDISVFDCLPALSDFHAQHSALSRSYTYHGHFRKNPFLGQLSAFYGHWPLDFEKMETATTLLASISDFRAVCKQPHLYKNTTCTLSRAELTVDGTNGRFHFNFTANRFLRNMVRLMVGNVIEIGRGRMSIDQWKSYLENGTRPPHFKLAKPEGLYLSGVHYEAFKNYSFFHNPLL